MDWTQYWFMFPVAMCIATSAMLSGIGGAALFIPIFVIIFPLLGPEYPLATSAAIGAALMTEVFGFSSGFVGYYRKRLIDFKSALPFICVSVPVAIAGALMFGILQEQEVLLKGAYAVLMLILCPIILRHTPPRDMLSESDDNDAVNAQSEIREITGRNGQTYRFRKPKQGFIGAFFTSIGSFLTGFLGVGVGEVILSQLVKRNHVPVAITDRPAAAGSDRSAQARKSDRASVRDYRPGHGLDRPQGPDLADPITAVAYTQPTFCWLFPHIGLAKRH